MILKYFKKLHIYVTIFFLLLLTGIVNILGFIIWFVVESIEVLLDILEWVLEKIQTYKEKIMEKL